jgi:hypothetical protein
VQKRAPEKTVVILPALLHTAFVRQLEMFGLSASFPKPRKELTERGIWIGLF